MKELIALYLKDHSLAWSPNTLRSERYRLQGVASHITGDPRELWDALEARGTKPYTRNTVWVRVTSLWDWLLKNGHRIGLNPYAEFREKNARLFKNSYVRKVPTLTIEEARARIMSLEDPEIRAKALDLLSSGMRYSESLTYQDGRVVGKGGKSRVVYLPGARPARYSKSYNTFWRQLARVGLKPHDLRKLCMSNLVDKGANTFELCEAAGWSDPKTAASYIAVKQSRLKSLFSK